MKTSETRIRRLLVVGGIGVLAAAVTNAVIYGIGRVAGVDFVVSESGKGVESVQLAHVLSLTLISFALGLAAAVVAAACKRPSTRTLQGLGAVLAVVSTWGDFTIDGSVAAKALLASMHIVVGVAYIASLQTARSSATRTEATVVVGNRTRFETLAA